MLAAPEASGGWGGRCEDKHRREPASLLRPAGPGESASADRKSRRGEARRGEVSGAAGGPRPSGGGPGGGPSGGGTRGRARGGRTGSRGSTQAGGNGAGPRGSSQAGDGSRLRTMALPLEVNSKQQRYCWFISVCHTVGDFWLKNTVQQCWKCFWH